VTTVTARQGSTLESNDPSLKRRKEQTMSTPRTNILTTLLATLALAPMAMTADLGGAATAQTKRITPAVQSANAGYIVQAGSMAEARVAVRRVRGRITHELDIIDAVGATLSPAQAETLRAAGITLFEDAEVRTTTTEAFRVGGGEGGGSTQDTYYPTQTSAATLHGMGITGAGVGIAIVDSGLMPEKSLVNGSAGQVRLTAGYDAIANSLVSKLTNTDTDAYGHGTHLASIAVSSRIGPNGGYNGVAPDANLVYVKAFDGLGRGSYANVIRGINWVVSNRSKRNIRVMNLSFAAPPQSWYWNDPLNQAVMKAWQAGIVVVAAAGNSGPDAMTIGVPGNVPYVVTVGAMSDNFTRNDPTDDRLASFSSAGPTYEGFVKPEIVAPGGHVLGLMGPNDYLPNTYKEFFDGSYYFQMSGTSQATAVTAGVVALLLQAQPSLTPDQVKCKLISSARPAVKSDGSLAYSVFQQGFGMVDAALALVNPYTTCGNQGLDIAAELVGTKRHGGPARQDASGNYYVVDANGNPVGGAGYLWNNGYLWNQGYLWTNGYLWSQGYLWNQGYLWSSGYLWSNGYLWSQSTVAPTTTSVTTNTMVPQE
jgi:subtilisin family serine protease